MIEDQVVVITGGAGGIGRALVLRFLEAGARVVFGDIDETGAKALLDAADGENLRFLPTDVTREADIERLIGHALDEFGGLDCVIGNAGTAIAFETLTDMTVASWDAQMALSLRSVMLGLKHGARALIAQGRGGALLAIGSIAAQAGGCGPLAYASAKAAAVNLVKHAAVELAPHRIRVNSISPGVIFTPRFAAGGFAPAEVAAHQPWPQVGTPEDVAEVALFLAGSGAGFVTGSDYVVDGGLTALGPHWLRRMFGPG